MTSLEGRVALVTGGGQGLGRAHALALAAHGASVVVNDVGVADGRPTAEAVAGEIIAAGGSAVADRSDIGSAEGAAAAVGTGVDAFGSLDVLVCNAGIVRDTSFAKMSHELWDVVLRVHLGGTYHTVKAAWAGMRERGYGRVIVTTSASGLYGSFGQANYGAAKMGIVGLMNTLALEGEKYGIRVNAISPVATTPMTEALMSPDLRAALDPEYVSPAVVYLASQECPLSGSILHVRGDQYAAVQLYQSAPVSFGKRPTPEEFAARIDDVLDFTGALPGAEAWSRRAL